MENQRKIKNFLLNPKLQISFGVACSSLAITYTIALMYFLHINFDSAIQLYIQNAPLGGNELDALIRIREKWILSRLIAVAILFVVSMVTLSIFYTHRMVGPVIQMIRHVQELKNGNFNSRVVLRKGDAFQELADELNQLAEKSKH